MRSNVRTFVEQQQFFFETLWSKATPAELRIKEIEEGLEPMKTKIIENSKELVEQIFDFTNNSKEIKACSLIEGIKLSYDIFYDSYKKLLEKYKNKEHGGVRWVTSINNKEDAELIKNYLNESIKIRHVKDVSFYNFSLSDKEVLSTIDKMDAGLMVTSALLSNNPLYINHYNSIFEKMWKTGIDAMERIKDIEEGNQANIEIIPNSKELINIFSELFNGANNEILLILSSANSIDRFENNDDFSKYEKLANKGIKTKILVSVSTELQNKINRLKEQYPKIEFRLLQKGMESFIGIAVFDREKVLLLEIKDDSKKDYISSIGLTVFIDSKSVASSYASIFDSLWKQNELYNEIRNAYEKIQIHDKMQRFYQCCCTRASYTDTSNSWLYRTS
jgi:hypothetical protein